MSNKQVVLDFINACNSRGIERIMSFFDPDECVFHNIPWEPLSGIGPIREFLSNMLNSSSEINWQVHNIAETDTGAVLTERTDRFNFQGKPMQVPVMGAFELRNGKITAWRDYFDNAQVRKQLPGSANSNNPTETISQQGD